ncbi:MAG: VTT domain-containing protein [Pseudotabrizicola sp.]|uniref:YqaA family protein n=1 Tax=Pseudotabrizicola sp. TaxID=2939647 RepID=UPI0027238373|nr:VTT domain-containing protein [Pseudotabrizicola sp.]MDO9639506.1 VTT domain-containing protein [Pseudotabrizicola sp.]
MLTGTSLLGLFVAALLAATPIPFQSEVVFLALMAQGTLPVVALVGVASVGNILGSCITYALGRGLGGARGARWLGLTPERQARAERWFGRWGVWALLLSWAPGGDFIVALSGALRVPLPRFLALVAIAKTARYAVVALIGLGIWG